MVEKDISLDAKEEKMLQSLMAPLENLQLPPDFKERIRTKLWAAPEISVSTPEEKKEKKRLSAKKEEQELQDLFVPLMDLRLPSDFKERICAKLWASTEGSVLEPEIKEKLLEIMKRRFLMNRLKRLDLTEVEEVGSIYQKSVRKSSKNRDKNELK